MNTGGLPSTHHRSWKCEIMMPVVVVVMMMIAKMN